MLYDQIQRKGKFIESCESSTTNNEMVNSIEYLSILLYIYCNLQRIINKNIHLGYVCTYIFFNS